MSRPRLLSLAVYPQHDLLVLRLLARRRSALEDRCQELRQQMLAAAEMLGTAYVLVDLGEVEWLSNLVIGPMVHVLKLVVRERRGAVLVCNANLVSREYLQIVRLDRIFRLCADEAAALAQVAAFRSGVEEPWRWPPRPSS
jgi:anti-anti-sigma regulatory factor